MASHPAGSSVLAQARAPAKLILLGEHAVVYGRPALAVPVTAVGARATVYDGHRPFTLRSQSISPTGAVEFEMEIALSDAPADNPLAVAARASLARVGLAEPPAWFVEIESTIPVSRGMGSSAAVAIATIRALAGAAGAALEVGEVSRLALAAERCAHGSPSGIDNSVVSLESPIRFRAGDYWPVNVGAPLCLVLADSGPSLPTREMVAGVRERAEASPELYGQWFDQIGKHADDGAAALAAGDTVTLGRIMDSNHLLLQAMQVSTPAMDRIVAAARAAGALGAKLSGAGGGGIVVALVDDHAHTAVADAAGTAGAEHVLQATVQAQRPRQETP